MRFIDPEDARAMKALEEQTKGKRYKALLGGIAPIWIYDPCCQAEIEARHIGHVLMPVVMFLLELFNYTLNMGGHEGHEYWPIKMDIDSGEPIPPRTPVQ